MAYSRWLGSYWYTYWHNQGNVPQPERRDDQLFSVDCNWLFTYRQLKDDIEACITKVMDGVKARNTVQPTEEEISELMGYMREFINDVENKQELV